MVKRVVIIGGGAAGMMAAVQAARNGADVLLFEKNEKLGKKLYIITIAIFLLMVCFVDKNNLVERYRLYNEIRELEQQKIYYLEQIRKDSLEIESLKSDSSLERIARELYLMKRKNETIFIVNEK